ncbi:MAG: hypothetical protein JO264_13030 [Acidisphaera sp.]|nr:hypothetical protein [Acidisphaera sp.]
MSTISRDLMRAVLEVRDHRHNETHGALVALYQALVCELLEAGVLEAPPLAERIERARAAVPSDVHGDAARHLLSHVAEWLRGVHLDLPVAAPEPWRAPGLAVEAAEATIRVPVAGAR